MKILLIISSVFIIAIIIFLSLKNTKKIRKENADLLNFVFTIIATFFGVFLAIYMNNYSLQEQNIDTTIKLLNASVYEIELIETETDLVKNELSNVTNFKQKILTYKFPYPSIFPRLMKNDLVIQNISEKSLKALNNSWRSSIFYYNSISDVNEVMSRSNENINKIINMYGKNLTLSKKLILNEIKFLKGEISRKKLSENIDTEYNMLNK